MFRTRRVARPALLVPALLALPLVLVACGDDRDDTAVADPAPVITDAARTTGDAPAGNSPTGGCPAPASSAIDVETEAGEPAVSVPLPEGWKRDSAFELSAVRLAMIESGPSRLDAASASVIIDTYPQSGVDAASARIAETVEQNMSTRVTDRHPESSVCGFPSIRVDYVSGGNPTAGIDPFDASSVFVAVPAADGGSTVVTVTVNGTGDDADKILDGFTVSEGV